MYMHEHNHMFHIFKLVHIYIMRQKLEEHGYGYVCADFPAFVPPEFQKY